MLEQLGASQTLIDIFKNDFNKSISNEVEVEFGDDYVQHLKDVGDFLIEVNEAELLLDTINLGKIGFEESENLKYEITFGQWKEVSRFNSDDNELDYEEEEEKKLKPLTNLIDQYFTKTPKNHLDKILFLIADFGKGKSVFLKKYASLLAKEYLEAYEGYFPVYFNLRNFHNYQQSTRLGVIRYYLQTKYAINIDSDYYRKKKYVFLIDSLDESGELNKSSIENVINSVKQIQSIDKVKFRTNRIIITSRPFADGLEYQLKNHSPYCMKNSEKRDIEYFISLYGFKKDQFNDWLISTLKDSNRKIITDKVEFVSRIFESIKKGKNIDVYEELMQNNTLTSSELRRPIFAYMIYQLILNNIDFLKVGKIGVYLSFLNLLSKEAKHIKDPSYKIKLEEEFEFRNILHATSALWMFERHQGNQGFLNKADLCRVLDGTDNRETDIEIIERYKNQGVVEIKFLSHSYFGENDNTLHFQHQSFAEILLAEYYLKIFIKYALDEDTNLEEARAKLILGMPTSQTINFFNELLQLLLETSRKGKTEEIIEKRKLLFPLVASLGTKKNNNLFCHDIFYEWFKKIKLKENQSEFPVNSLSNWYFKEEQISKIVELAKSIINSKNNFILTKADTKSSLYDNELLSLQNSKLSNITHDIDRWLALLVGNTLYNDYSNQSKPKLFNTDFKINPQNLFDLILTLEYSNTESSVEKSWRNNLFRGIDMRNETTRIRFYSILNYYDFSYSYLNRIDFSGCLFGHTNFSNCHLINTNFSHSYFWEPMFENVIEFKGCRMNHIIVSGIFIPSLNFFMNEFKQKIYIPFGKYDDKVFEELSSLLSMINFSIKHYGKNNKLKQEDIQSHFVFESEIVEKIFFNALFNEEKLLPPTKVTVAQPHNYSDHRTKTKLCKDACF
jgi:uncharacterized protein YjbI with pentapeptide repeats